MRIETMEDVSPLDALYGAPLEDFVNLRNTYAKQLSGEGDAGASADVKSRKKPTVSAWLVNQLVRARPDDIQALITAGEEIEAAQRKALSGERAGFDTARRAETAAVERLRAAASEVMPAVTSATLERVTSSLIAGARSAEGRAALAAGRLSQDLEHRGFEAFAGFAVAAPAEPEPSEDLRSEQVQLLENRRTQAERAWSEALDAAERTEAQAVIAEREAARVRSEAERARRAAVEAEAALKEVDDALDRARRSS